MHTFTLDDLVRRIVRDIVLEELANAEAPRRALSVREAASVLSMSRSGLYDLIASGAVRTVKVGKRRLIPDSEIRRLLGDEAQEARR
jgi:excisionase family DNA binding protein